MSIITGLIGPSEGVFRWSDLGVWMSIAWSAMLVSLVYGTIFCSFGILWKNGVILAIIFAAWELGMAFVAILTGGDSSVRYMSVIGWGMIVVDAGVAISLAKHLATDRSRIVGVEDMVTKIGEEKSLTNLYLAQSHLLLSLEPLILA